MIRRWLKRNMEDKIVDIVIYVFCALVLFMTVYPFYYILVISFNEGIDASFGGIYWFPRKFTLENYTDFFGRKVDYGIGDICTQNCGWNDNWSVVHHFGCIWSFF